MKKGWDKAAAEKTDLKLTGEAIVFVEFETAS